MNILFAYGFCGLGGVETALLNRCEALQARGIRTTMFFRQFYGDGAAHIARLPHVRLGLDQVPSLFAQDFDAICVVDYPDFVALARKLAPAACLMLETHASITTRLIDFHRLADDEGVEGMIVPSRFNRDLVLRVAQGRRPIHIVPNGIDTGAFRPRTAEEVAGRFGGNPRSPVYLWVGRLEDEKNPHGFLEFSKAVAKLQPAARFLWIGDAPHDEEYLPRLQRALSPQDRSRHTFIPAAQNMEMPLYYSLAAVTGGCLVSTSRFESVPMIFLEAMACGCPVLSTDVGGVRELLSHERTGLLFAVDDVVGAAHSASRLEARGSQQLRTRVTDEALKFVREHHSLESVAGRFGDVLAAMRVK
jgi:glycosyltransferase involved in cell wall biosynthesis